MSECWLPIPGFTVYEASDHGRIRSIDRIVNGRLVRGVILSPQTRKPWPRLWVKLSKGGIRTKHGVGALILTTFVGPCPSGLECCHNDGDPTNNRPINLRWDTHSANVLDQVRHGTHFAASRTRCDNGHLLEPLKYDPTRRSCLKCKVTKDRDRRRRQRKCAA